MKNVYIKKAFYGRNLYNKDYNLSNKQLLLDYILECAACFLDIP